jgi:hypothetical protein
MGYTSLEFSIARLSSANTGGLFQCSHKYPAIAYFAGVVSPDERRDGVVDLVVGNRDFEFHLCQEIDRVLGTLENDMPVRLAVPEQGASFCTTRPHPRLMGRFGLSIDEIHASALFSPSQVGQHWYHRRMSS